MNDALRKLCWVAALTLAFAAIVTLWVDLADSGRSGVGTLLAGGGKSATVEHVYGAKSSPLRMLYEAVGYIGLLAQGLAAVLIAMGKAARFVQLAAVLGTLLSAHRCALVLVDQRPTWIVDLVASVVTLAGCVLAIIVAARLARSASCP
jgi:hypothetical protein